MIFLMLFQRFPFAAIRVELNLKNQYYINLQHLQLKSNLSELIYKCLPQKSAKILQLNSNFTQILQFYIYLQTKMSVHILQDLAIQIYTFHNFKIKQKGSYFLRFKLFHKDSRSNQIISSVPLSILQTSQLKFSVRKSEINKDSFLTSEIQIKDEDDLIIINEMCLFHSSIVLNSLDNNIVINLQCDLLFKDQYSFNKQNFKKCCSFNADIKNSHCAESLQIIFDDKYPSTIIGTIHSVSYKCQFRNNQSILKIKDLDQTLLTQSFKNILHDYTTSEQKLYHSYQYDKNITKHDIQKILNHYVELIQQELTYIQILYTSYYKLLQSSKQQIRQFTNEELSKIKKCLEENKQRRKIFQTISQKNFQQKISKLSSRIRHLWQNLILIISKTPKLINTERQKNYRLKIKQKYLQCYMKTQIKGDWGLQKTQNIGQEHIINARKIRNGDVKDSVGLFFIDKSLFPHPKYKPIIFQQTFVNSYHQQQINSYIKTIQKHLIVLVHGFGGCRYDMEKLLFTLKRMDRSIQCFIPISNQGKTQTDIIMMGQRLAKEILSFMSNNSYSKEIKKISFIGHSMGGLIIRAALPKLEQLNNKFFSYISISTPHLGLNYNPLKLIQNNTWMINNAKKSFSISQLCLQDNNNIQETFIFKLSKFKGLQWFKKIALISSYQDTYIPYNSARITKTISPQIQRKYIKKYDEIVQNIMSRLKGVKGPKLYRIDVNFYMSEQGIDILNGRAAHINLLNSVELINMLTMNCAHIFS